MGSSGKKVAALVFSSETVLFASSSWIFVACRILLHDIHHGCDGITSFTRIAPYKTHISFIIIMLKGKGNQIIITLARSYFLVFAFALCPSHYLPIVRRMTDFEPTCLDTLSLRDTVGDERQP